MSMMILVLALAACGSNNGGNGGEGNQAENTTAAGNGASNTTSTNTAANAGGTEAADAAATRTITYLDQQVEVPGKVERIVITGSMEAMEDALVLDVKPVGAITFAGQFPALFAPITGEAESIGEKSEPNYETILGLKPDVILGTSKFKPEVVDQLKKIAPLIQVSHISTNWEANITLLGELTGKQDLAQQEIEQYKADAEAAKVTLAEKVKDKKVVAIRIRAGKMFVYPETVFVNPLLYGDLGLTPPAEVTSAKAQAEISVEQFAAMNPDYLFIQFSESENADTPNALDELKNNPIMKNVNALKNDKAFVNVIDPLAEGGPAWSRINFLKAAVEKLSQ